MHDRIAKAIVDHTSQGGVDLTTAQTTEWKWIEGAEAPIGSHSRRVKPVKSLDVPDPNLFCFWFTDQYLPGQEQRGWELTGPVTRMKQGERNPGKVYGESDPASAVVVDDILGRVLQQEKEASEARTSAASEEAKDPQKHTLSSTPKASSPPKELKPHKTEPHKTKELKPHKTDQKPITIGARVKIVGLKTQPSLNDQLGTVDRHLAEKGRYQIRLDQGGNVALKPMNCILQPPQAPEESATAVVQEPPQASASPETSPKHSPKIDSPVTVSDLSEKLQEKSQEADWQKDCSKLVLKGIGKISKDLKDLKDLKARRDGLKRRVEELREAGRGARRDTHPRQESDDKLPVGGTWSGWQTVHPGWSLTGQIATQIREAQGR